MSASAPLPDSNASSIHLDRDLSVPRGNAIGTLQELAEVFAAVSGMQR